MKRKVLKFARLIVVYALTFLVLTLSDPAKLPSSALVVPFILIFFAVYCAIAALFELLDAEQLIGMKVRRPRTIAALIAGFPVLLLVLQSIGQLTSWDVLMTAALFVVTYFYIIKAASATS